MSIMEYNGSGIVAMTGKNCVAIASDLRYGIQQLTIADNMQRIFPITDRCFMGLAGLATDMTTVHNKMIFRSKLYELREERKIKATTFANNLSSLLYEHRFGPYFVEPVVAGLEDKKDEKGVLHKNVPFICAMDLIGAPCTAEDFVVAGTSGEELYGCAEAFYKPNLGPDELFETTAQTLLAAVDRDCLAGWGAVVHVLTPDKIITKTLKTRKD